MTTPRQCVNCGITLTKKSQKKFCSGECAIQYRRKKHFDDLEACGMAPVSGRFNETNRRLMRVYLEHKNGHRCAVCGRTTWNKQPIPLVVDHIDGNVDNNQLVNFRLLCPNCDAQQATYKARNTVQPSYKAGTRSVRRAEEYGRALTKHGLERCAPRVRAQGTCPICNKVFAKRRLSQIYCSRACADIMRGTKKSV